MAYPNEADVRAGVTFGDADEFTGSAEIPAAASVLEGVPVDATVGTYLPVAASNVAEGTAFGPAGGATGTYDPTSIIRRSLYVSKDGDNGDAGSSGEPFATVDHAMSEAVTGDTIFVSGLEPVATHPKPGVTVIRG